MTQMNYIAGLFTSKNDGGQDAIPSKSIGTVSNETYQSKCPWRNCYRDSNGNLNGTNKPKNWSVVDTFVNSELGFKVQYESVYTPYSRGRAIEKKLNRYSAPLANRKIKLTKSNIKEADIMKGVKVVQEDCNLSQTTLTSAPSLKRVGYNLTLDTSSALKSLKGLEEVGGKLCVIAKNKEEMNAFLIKLGLMTKDGALIPTVKKGLDFVMKTYL